MRVCPNCQEIQTEDGVFCEECGCNISALDIQENTAPTISETATEVAATELTPEETFDQAAEVLDKTAQLLKNGGQSALKAAAVGGEKAMKAAAVGGGKAMKAAAAGGEKAKQAATEKVNKVQEQRKEDAEKKKNKNPLDDMLLSSEETILASLGVSSLEGFTFSKTIGVVTDKRFYFRGKNIQLGFDKVRANQVNGAFNLEDVILTEYRSSKNIIFLILMILSLFLLIPSGGITAITAIIFGILYHLSKERYFVVGVPGGGYAFDTSDYKGEELKEFQSYIHIGKDRLNER